MRQEYKHIPLTYPIEGLQPIQQGEQLYKGELLVALGSKGSRLLAGDVVVLQEDVYVFSDSRDTGTTAEVYRLRGESEGGYFMWRFARMHQTTKRDEAL